MLGREELTRHLARKEALLRASEKNRAVLRAEGAKLREVAAWVDTGMSLARKARTIWSVIAPLLNMRGIPVKGSSGLFAKLTQGFALARSLAAFWRS